MIIMSRNLMLILGLCLLLIGCAETSSQDIEGSSTKNEADETIAALETELEKMKEEIERLKLVEEIYMAEKVAYADISLNVNILLIALKEMNTVKMIDYLHPEVTIEEIDHELYFYNGDYEFKMTYNNDEQQLERWFVESITLTDLDEAEVLVRTHYLDENQESVKEDRPFVLNFAKEDEHWLLTNFLVN